MPFTNFYSYFYALLTFFSSIIFLFFPFSVPPDIINEESSTDISVQEGEDATLVCKATGHPTPRVIWRREDGEHILMKKSGVSGKELMKCKQCIHENHSLSFLFLLNYQAAHEKFKQYYPGEVGGYFPVCEFHNRVIIFMLWHLMFHKKERERILKLVLWPMRLLERGA